MRKTMEKMKEKKGITLIALVATIAVILILAGITVGMVTSDNGILRETKNAKNLAEIDNEKSIVERAKMLTIMRSKNGLITYDVFEPALKEEAGKLSTEVSDAVETIEVLFTNSKRCYEIDEDGNVGEPQEVVKDKYAGDITKGGRCDGSEEKPYEISCIEDLVMFSKNVNGGNSYGEKYIRLTRNLNFDSMLSYNDYTNMEYGDLNNDSIIENIKTELTKKEDNCTGFTPIGNENTNFKGIFLGEGHKINNIYENVNSNAGLFGNISENVQILDLTISGTIKSSKAAGGICGTADGATIKNCINYATVRGTGAVGGVIGRGEYTQLNIFNCKNYAELNNLSSQNDSEAACGGIAGLAIKATIINCSNEKTSIVEGKASRVGGIIGYLRTAKGGIKIYNCYNIGKISSEISGSGEIIGYIYSVGKIANTYSVGEISGKEIGGIVGSALYNNTANEFTNCYYKKSDTAKTAAGKYIPNTVATGLDSVNEDVINTLNAYVEEHKNDYEVPLKEWKIETINGEKVLVFID